MSPEKKSFNIYITFKQHLHLTFLVLWSFLTNQFHHLFIDKRHFVYYYDILIFELGYYVSLFLTFW